MNLPHRRVPERDPFNQNVLAPVRLNELWPQVTAFTIDALVYGRSVGHLFVQERARLTLIRIAFLPSALRSSFPRPPMIAISITVDHAFACDRHIRLLKRVDQRRVVHQLHAFPSRKNQWQVLLRILAELDRRPLRDMEVDVALEMNRSGRIDTRRYQHTSTARFVTGFDRLAKGLSTVNLSVS